MNTYTPLILGIPGKPAVPDTYQPSSTIHCPGCMELIVQVNDAPVLISFGTGTPSPLWGSDEPLQPAVGSLARSFDAFRVRNMTPGVAAQVMLTPVPSGQPYVHP